MTTVPVAVEIEGTALRVRCSRCGDVAMVCQAPLPPAARMFVKSYLREAAGRLPSGTLIYCGPCAKELGTWPLK